MYPAKILALVVGLCLPTFVMGNIRVIDGDTFDLEDQTIRLHGIDAPERGQRCNGFSGSWACGDVAMVGLQNLLTTGQVSCDVHGRDAYGRSIARCLVDGRDIAAALVENGYAWAFVRYSDDYIGQEARARGAARGIWQAKTEAPWAFRDRRWAAAAQHAPDGCPIKGNISANGRIYHAPWSKWYSRTRINTSKGERWFCSEADALQAGWRAPRS